MLWILNFLMLLIGFLAETMESIVVCVPNNYLTDFNIERKYMVCFYVVFLYKFLSYVLCFIKCRLLVAE